MNRLVQQSRPNYDGASTATRQPGRQTYFGPRPASDRCKFLLVVACNPLFRPPMQGGPDKPRNPIHSETTPKNRVGQPKTYGLI